MKTEISWIDNEMADIRLFLGINGLSGNILIKTNSHYILEFISVFLFFSLSLSLNSLDIEQFIFS